MGQEFESLMLHNLIVDDNSLIILLLSELDVGTSNIICIIRAFLINFNMYNVMLNNLDNNFNPICYLCNKPIIGYRSVNNTYLVHTKCFNKLNNK